MQLRVTTPTALAWVQRLLEIRRCYLPRKDAQSLTRGCQFSYCFCRLAPMVSRAFWGPIDKGSEEARREALQGQVPAHSSLPGHPDPRPHGRAQGSSVLSRWPFRGVWLTRPVSPSRPRGAGGPHSAQPPLALSPASGQRLGVRGGPATRPQPLPPHRSRGGGHTQRGKVWEHPRTQRGSGFAHVSRGRF